MNDSSEQLKTKTTWQLQSREGRKQWSNLWGPIDDEVAAEADWKRQMSFAHETPGLKFRMVKKTVTLSVSHTQI